MAYDDTEILPDSVILAFISMLEDKYPADTACCYLTYYTIIQSSKYLIKKLINEGRNNLGGGEAKHKEDDVLLEFKSGDSGIVDYLNTWLDDFIANPVDQLPCMQGKGNVTNSRIILGGVRKDRIRKVNNNSNGQSGGYSIGETAASRGVVDVDHPYKLIPPKRNR
jgi:hypothetical protein